MRSDDRKHLACHRLAILLPALLFLLVLVLAPAQAQVPGKDQPAQVTYPLPLRDMAGVDNGKVGVVRGKTGSKGHRFIVDKLWMTNPVSVTLMAQADGDEVKLDLIKFPWDKPVRSATTERGTRYVNEKFRTQGEFLLHVTSPVENTPYQLVVWVGNEVVPEMPAVVVDRATYEANLAAGKHASSKTWFVAAALGGLLVLAAIAILYRRRKS